MSMCWSPLENVDYEFVLTSTAVPCCMAGEMRSKWPHSCFFVGWWCCILTLDLAVNQRFSAEDVHVKINGGSHVVERKCVGVMRWYIQMPTWDRSSLRERVLSQSQLAVTGMLPSDWSPCWGSVPRYVPQRASGWVPLAEKQEKC